MLFSSSQPIEYLTPIKITQLLQVRREGNPLRRYAHVSPFMGKLQPVNDHALNCFAGSAIAALPPLQGSTLVMGLAESSLLLAWWLTYTLSVPTHLCLTSRHSGGHPDERNFTEPHSHAPRHFFQLPPQQHYTQVLIVEDELTTGTTVKHLINALRDVATTFYVLSLCDLRTPAQKADMHHELENLQVDIIDLSTCQQVQPLPIQKYPKDVSSFTGLQLQYHWSLHPPDTLYVFGECIIVALGFWLSQSPTTRPYLRHVTRSPWEVDHQFIESRVDLTDNEVPYYLYNWEQPSKPRQALIISDFSTRAAANQLAAFLTQQSVAVDIIETI